MVWHMLLGIIDYHLILCCIFYEFVDRTANIHIDSTLCYESTRFLSIFGHSAYHNYAEFNNPYNYYNTSPYIEMFQCSLSYTFDLTCA